MSLTLVLRTLLCGIWLIRQMECFNGGRGIMKSGGGGWVVVLSPPRGSNSYRFLDLFLSPKAQGGCAASAINIFVEYFAVDNYRASVHAVIWSVRITNSPTPDYSWTRWNTADAQLHDLFTFHIWPFLLRLIQCLLRDGWDPEKRLRVKLSPPSAY
jgi:hypothetical protein